MYSLFIRGPPWSVDPLFPYPLSFTKNVDYDGMGRASIRSIRFKKGLGGRIGQKKIICLRGLDPPRSKLRFGNYFVG